MSKHLKGKTFNRRRRHKKSNKTGKINHSRRNKITGGGVSLVIPHIDRMNNGGSDSQASLENIYRNADTQQRIVNALTGGSGIPETYTVPTFTNGGDPHSNIPNSNSVIRALIGGLVESQVQSEYDKNAFKQSGGRRKSRRYKSSKKYRKSKKSKRSRKSRK